MCSFSKNFVNQFKIQRFSHQVTTKRWLCCSQDSISPENEYRSSRNIAISLLRRYRSFVERGGGDNLKFDGHPHSVSDQMLLQWKGFCAIIANAYYMRGMAWLPVKTLQLEQMAVMGNAEEPSVVASRMRLVFSTLEVVSPQWPRV